MISFSIHRCSKIMGQLNPLFDEITHIINKIKKDWDRATTNGQQISRIDKDILIADLRIAYDLASDLDVTRTSSILRENSIPSISNTLPPNDEFPTIQQTGENLPRESLETLKPEVPIKEAPETREILLEMNQPEIMSNPKEDHRTQPNQPKMMVDLFSAPKTVSDVLHGNGDHSIASKIQNNRISDIKAAIGINDKFTFINDIFKGEISRYNQVIERLNGFGNIREALEFVKHEGLETGTAENKAAILRLTDLIKRRY